MALRPNQIDKIKKLRQQGFSIREIAKKIGRDKNTITKYLKESVRPSLIEKLTGTKKASQKNIIDSSQIIDESYKSYQPGFNNINGSPRFFKLGQYEINPAYQQMEQEKRIEDQRLEGERKRKYYQDIGAKLRLLKQKKEEQESREREQSQMNQLQHGIEMLKIDQKYIRYAFEERKKLTKAPDNISIFKKKEEKEPEVLKSALALEDLREKQDTSNNDDKREIIQKPEASPVVLSEVPTSQALKEEGEEDTGLPDWVPIVASSFIQVACKKIKRYFAFLDSPYSKLPKDSPEYRKKLLEYLFQNN